MSDQITDRRAKLEKIRALGVDPYGARFVDITPNAVIRAAAEKLPLEAGQIRAEADAHFRAAGRVVLYRDIGSLIFMTVRDRTGELQFGLSKKMLLEATQPRSHEATQGSDGGGPAPAAGDVQWKVAKLLDLGDVVGVEGQLGRTKTGELTLWARSLTLLSKALRPPPEKWHGLTDVEARYRRRYVDLLSNPDSQRVFLLRARIMDHARAVLARRGFIEVDTPVLQPIYGGAAARPFMTHHNTLDMDLFLRIAPELYLKRLIVGGLERVFEVNRNFRNEGISTQHNPEFTMLEFYWAYATYQQLMELTEELCCFLAQSLFGKLSFTYQEREIDFSRPWKRLRMADAVAEYTDLSVEDLKDAATLKAFCQKHGLDIVGEATPGKLMVLIFEELVEAKLVQPTFIYHFPTEVSPLARRNDENPEIVDRFELYINGNEIANAFNELADPDDQRGRFVAQVEAKKAGDEEAHEYDADYIRALEYGLPPTAGEGIGIDRLVMLLTDSASIRDVILFPQMRKEQG